MAAILLLAAGCATTRIDWNSRVGQYTFDNAISELGVPDRQATLSDGTLVGEWLQSRGGAYGHSTWFGGPYSYNYDVSEFPDQYLRLTFSPDKKLVRATKFAR